MIGPAPLLALTLAAVAAVTVAVTCPPNAAYVPAVGVCVDQYEAALLVHDKVWPYNENVDDLADGEYVAVPAHGSKPQAYISGTQAATACAAAGKRLCHATEWLAACEGPQGFVYPYGNVYQPGTLRCWL